MTSYQLTSEVTAIGEISVTGNVIPSHWLQAITFDNGKPYFVAVMLLSEIRYWYTPTEIEDEETGLVVKVKNKFKADFLQRSTKKLAEKFGFSEKQVKDALRFLEKKGFIKRHFRTISYGDGIVASNVQFIEIIPESIRNIQKIPTYGRASPSARTCKSEGEDTQGGTYTKNTTSITTNIYKVNEEAKPQSMPSQKKKIKNPIDFLETSEEKKYYRTLIKLVPEEGKSLDPSSVSAWIKEFGVSRVKESVIVYWEQVAKSKNDVKVPIPREAGGYIRNILNNPTIKLENDNTRMNKEYAKELSKNNLHVKALDKYAKIEAGSFIDEIYYNAPPEAFKKWLNDKIEASKEYAA